MNINEASGLDLVGVTILEDEGGGARYRRDRKSQIKDLINN